MTTRPKWHQSNAMTGPLSKVLAVQHVGRCWLSEALGRLPVPLSGICGTVLAGWPPFFLQHTVFRHVRDGADTSPPAAERESPTSGTYGTVSRRL